MGQTNGFGTLILLDGSIVEPNPLGRIPDSQGSISLMDGSFVHKDVILEVRDSNGKLLWRKSLP